MPDLNNYVAVMQDDQVTEGNLYPVKVDGDALMLTRVEGEVFAVCGICTHEYAELWDGELEDETIWCPLHSSGFNVKTGEATNYPAVIPLPTYDVQIEDGQIYVSRTPKSSQE